MYAIVYTCYIVNATQTQTPHFYTQKIAKSLISPTPIDRATDIDTSTHLDLHVKLLDSGAKVPSPQTFNHTWEGGEGNAFTWAKSSPPLLEGTSLAPEA